MLAFHDRPEVVGVGDSVLESVVVRTDAPEEGVVPHDPAEHVQDPAALLVAVPVQEVEEVRLVLVDDGKEGVGGGEVRLGALLHPPTEVLDAVGVLEEDGTEVGGEPLGEPEVGPVRRGHGVAEPLVAELFSMPPKRVADWTWASFS